MRPIAKKLLIHTASYADTLSEDAWGTPVFTGNVELKNIRIEPCKTIVVTKDNKQLQLTSTLFYDCVHSIPKNHEFKFDGYINFNGISYQIKSIEPLYNGKKLHHYEIGLM